MSSLVNGISRTIAYTLLSFYSANIAISLCGQALLSFVVLLYDNQRLFVAFVSWAVLLHGFYRLYLARTRSPGTDPSPACAAQKKQRASFGSPGNNETETRSTTQTTQTDGQYITSAMEGRQRLQIEHLNGIVQGLRERLHREQRRSSSLQADYDTLKSNIDDFIDHTDEGERARNDEIVELKTQLQSKQQALDQCQQDLVDKLKAITQANHDMLRKDEEIYHYQKDLWAVQRNLT